MKFLLSTIILFTLIEFTHGQIQAITVYDINEGVDNSTPKHLNVCEGEVYFLAENPNYLSAL